MADAGVNIGKTEMEASDKHLEEPTQALTDIEFQASQVIERLEEAVEKAEKGRSESNGQAWENSYGFLPFLRKPKDEIMNILEDLIVFEEGKNRDDVAEDEGVSTPAIAVLPPLDSISRLAVLTQSIAAYASGLERQHLQRLVTKITSDVTRWLSHIFRFLDSASFFHDDPMDGVVRLTRMMLHYKYPKYLEDGYEALSSHPPVIYSSVASPLGVVQHICRQLGLPMFCVRPVPCNTMFGSQQKIDVAALERLMEEDAAGGRIPLIVLADAGTAVAGHADSVARIYELCRHHDAWLHLRGHGLAALALAAQPSIATPNSQPPSPLGDIMVGRIADSFTLPIGTWLGIPTLPMVTLYRLFEQTSMKPSRLVAAVGVPRESTLPIIAGLTADHSTRRLSCMSLWVTLQALGREGIHQRIRQAFESTEQLWRRLSKYPCLRLLSQQPGGESGTITVNELVTRPVNTSMLFEVVASTVVFQFIPEASEGNESGRVPSYYDKLNSWLGQILQRDAPQVPVEICELETSGVVLRYSPLELGQDRQPTVEDIDSFIICLEQQLDILSATVAHKATFQRLVSSTPNLCLVEMEGWAGLGGVRYVPEAWQTLLTDQAKEELNKLNVSLVEQLRSTDAAFSLGEGPDGLACVRFGMVTAETDVEELLGLVVSFGQEVEESSRFLETMTEIVKKGIETATLDLQKENEERLWQEGILRHVPVFGSLVNWWSPPSKEGGIKGRSLNLTAGVVESTENIYRYHMQLQQGVPPAPGTRSPPQPQVQTPIAPPSGKHSRSSSHSSQQSQSHTTPIGAVSSTPVEQHQTTP
ncbi:pyridoxal-dependent decarboxylase domain-containing protein 1 [Schistocerca piceifrons]|uniref:pyridoxal-dependent decarboxylase domain-containing protein 1 n=1 Tax=Schistocerca piceifrons TaxID=274613 RepID=UPI001F5EA719|nr:pyridoxal-dependent decarboxylase domain-containing protein 1 [Schistocerca piceifrons]